MVIMDSRNNRRSERSGELRIEGKGRFDDLDSLKGRPQPRKE